MVGVSFASCQAVSFSLAGVFLSTVSNHTTRDIKTCKIRAWNIAPAHMKSYSIVLAHSHAVAHTRQFCRIFSEGEFAGFK